MDFLQALCDSIRATIREGQNWPPTAMIAVIYRCIDRQFPTASSNEAVNTVYFNTEEEYLAWVAAEKLFVRDTDGDFRIEGRRYIWDLGPQYDREVYIGA